MIIQILIFILSKSFSNQIDMTEDQWQSAQYSRQKIRSIDGSLVTTSSIKLFVAPRDEIRRTVYRSAWYSKLLLGVGIFGIILIVLLAAAIMTLTNTQGNIIYNDIQ